MNVKCVDTGQLAPKENCYKAENGKYWSSEAAYLLWKNEDEWRNKCKDLMVNILFPNYKEGMKLPTILWKRIEEFSSMGHEIFYNAIVGERSSIEWALRSKQFKNPTKMISYVFRILENNMMKYYQEAQDAAEQKRINENMVIPENIEVDNKKQRSHDISRFLED